MCDGVSVKRSINGRRLVASTEILWYAVITGLLFCTVLAAFAPFASIAIWRTAPFSTAGVLMIAGICVVSACGRWAVLPQMRTPVYTPPEPGLRVAVVTAFVASSEPLAMLEQSLRA